MTTRNPSGPVDPLPRGRPRIWKDEAEKQRAHRGAARQKRQLLDDLLWAVREAEWEDPELMRKLNAGDDLTVLQALIAYYRDRHWSKQGQAQTDQAEEQKQ